MSWKIIERCNALLNTLAAVGTLYITMASYFGWNHQLQASSDTPVMIPHPPFWFFILPSVMLLLIATQWTIFFIRRRTPSDVHTKTLLDGVERLFADEHEIALWGRFQFGSEVNNRTAKLPDRDRFRQVVSALEEPCAELGLYKTRGAIKKAVDKLNRDIDVSEAHNAFHEVSATLKNELADRVRFVSR